MAFSNVWHTVGRRWLFQIANGLISRPANLYVGLRTLDGVGGHASDAALADTLTSNLYEVSGGGYARIAVLFDNTHWVESLSSVDSILTAAAQTFTFSGTITGVTHSFICTTSDNSGFLVCSAAVPAAVAKNFGNTDTYAVTPIMSAGTHS